MSKVIFSSCKPYLQIYLSRDKGICVTFDANCIYIPKNKAELQLLREYAERTKASCLITEGADNTELKRRYEALEAEEIQKAENREKTRQEAEKKRKEDHEFYSLLRMSDTVYR